MRFEPAGKAPDNIQRRTKARAVMKKLSPVVPVIIILLALPAIITGIQREAVAVAATSNPCIPMPPNPFYFTSTAGGYPTCTTVGLQLMPNSPTYGGVGWHALNYQNSTALVSINGTYTQTPNGAGVADGFTTMMFVQNGTGSLNYLNNSIPGASPGAGGLCQYGTQNFGSLLSFPNSTTPFFALQWDPFYGSSFQFNLFVINPGCALVNPHPASIGCSIGTPAPMPNDVIGLKTSYSPQINGGTLEALVDDFTANRKCSFTQGLVVDGFNRPPAGNYWVFVEANAGGGYADWTLVGAKISVASPTNWVPAGPSSNTLSIPIFSSASSEQAALFASPPTIDAMDVAPVPTTNCVAPNYVLTPPSTNYCYTSYWQRIIDSGVSATGTFNFFTSLNAYSDGSCLQAACTLPRLSPGTFRQGFSATTTSLNPYGATTAQDLYILRNVYDQLYRFVPVDRAELLDWMVFQHLNIPASSLTYTPPASTSMAIRNTLLPDIYWQDGRKLTAWDVAFSYESLMATLAPQLPSSGLLNCPSGPSCSVTGITILNPTTFDIDLNIMPTTITTAQIGDVGSLTIIPGYYWSNAGSTAWASAVASCFSMLCTPTIYSLTPGSPPGSPPTPACFPMTGPGCGSFPPSSMSSTPGRATAGFDPIANGQLIGSGPWSCQNTGASSSVPIGTLGTGCSSSNTQSPPVGGDFALTRFGCSLTSCYAPGSVLEQEYFRSSGVLALWIWSGMTGDNFHDNNLLFNQINPCYGQTPNTITASPPSSSCTHYQQGIGAGGFTTPSSVNGCSALPGQTCGVPVEMIEEDIAYVMISVNWISPYNWATSPPPTGVAPLSSLWLYEGTTTLFPASGANGVGCLPAYPLGGYDC